MTRESVVQAVAMTPKCKSSRRPCDEPLSAGLAVPFLCNQRTVNNSSQTNAGVKP